MTITINSSVLAMSGEVKMWPAAAIPDGWLVCNGAAVSRTIYASIFAVIGTTWGAGNGTTTFNLPNYQDKVPVGASAGKALGSYGGSAAQTPVGSVTIGATVLTIAQLPAHNHGVSDPGHAHSVYDPTHTHRYVRQDGGAAADFGASYAVGAQVYGYTDASATGIGIYGAATGITTTNTGSAGSHTHTGSFAGSSLSVEQPYAATNFIIKI